MDAQNNQIDGLLLLCRLVREGLQQISTTVRAGTALVCRHFEVWVQAADRSVADLEQTEDWRHAEPPQPTDLEMDLLEQGLLQAPVSPGQHVVIDVME